MYIDASLGVDIFMQFERLLRVDESLQLGAWTLVRKSTGTSCLDSCMQIETGA